MLITLFVLATVLLVFGVLMIVASFARRRADRLASSVLADRLMSALRSLRYAVVMPSSTTGRLRVTASNHGSLLSAVAALGELAGVGVSTSTRQVNGAAWAVVATQEGLRAIGWTLVGVPAEALCVTQGGVVSHACSNHTAAVATVAASAGVPISSIEVCQTCATHNAILSVIGEGVLGWVVCHEGGRSEEEIVAMVVGEWL